MSNVWPEGALVVGTINDSEDAAALAAAGAPGCDLVEWRLDGLQDMPGEVLRAAVAATPQPVILTARREDEGGFSPWPNETTRQAALEVLVAPGRAIDIEARSLESSVPWREAALHWRASGAVLVVSLHDFSGVPDLDRLAEAVAVAEEIGATVFKIAATPRTLDEMGVLGKVFSLCRRCEPSLMAMGHFGRASRLLFGRAGSRLNYGYLRRASVPGQWPAEELRHLLHE